MPMPSKKPRPKIQGTTGKGTNPYATQYNIGSYGVGSGLFGYEAPSGGIGPRTGRPAGGYRATPPLAPGAAATIADFERRQKSQAKAQARTKAKNAIARGKVK